MVGLGTEIRERSNVPPMGQGLAVVALIAALGLLILAGIGLYLFSLHVAAVHNQGRALDDQLLAKRQEVQKLRNELDVRSRFVELERWGPTLGLGTATGPQYVAGLHQLDSAANVRRTELQKVALARTSCAGGPAPQSQCQSGPASGRSGYTPQPRQQMDHLIDGIL
jgi:hypothetical protein